MIVGEDQNNYRLNGLQYVNMTVSPSIHTDLTPPVLLITSHPSASSYYSTWNFTFSCVNEWKCHYWCSLILSNTVEKYVFCDGGYFIAANLQVGQAYIFSVFAVDGVGNIGNPEIYNWKFGKSLLVLVMIIHFFAKQY